ncbi:MAG: hypothetical protein D6696_13210, partial [Acidobacteria bacterium]
RALAAGLLVVAAAAAPQAAGAGAGSWTFAGSLALELRYFPQQPAFAGQVDGVQPSVALAPEWRWRSAGRRHRLDVAAFGRWDGRDGERRHLDLREASYRYVGDSVELLAGISRVFWGVTESRHLVDVINQTDAVEDVDEEDKLGQPMVRLAWGRPWGRLELYALLGFRRRTLPGEEGRLRPPLPVDRRARFASGAGADRLDWALRYSHATGGWDVGAYLFRGVGRGPRLVPAADGRRLLPLYQVVDQAGIDVQHTRGAWLFKLEALARAGQGRGFGAAVAGFERTVYQVAGSAADVGLLLELLWDGRGPTAPATSFDRDLFAGARLALNDVPSSQLLAGAVIDLGDGSVAAFVEASRRVGGRYVVELEARLFPRADPAGDLAAVARDGFVTLRAAWHW